MTFSDQYLPQRGREPLSQEEGLNMASEKEVQLRDLPKTQHEALEKQWAQVVAKAWSDAAFKKRLLAQPEAVLKEAGVVVPEGVQFKVVEDTASVRHLILPPKPDSCEVSVEELAAVVGGVNRTCVDERHCLGGHGT
jgi:hypothetical protein